jgi:hypothetical protein
MAGAMGNAVVMAKGSKMASVVRRILVVATVKDYNAE